MISTDPKDIQAAIARAKTIGRAAAAYVEAQASMGFVEVPDAAPRPRLTIIKGGKS